MPLAHSTLVAYWHSYFSKYVPTPPLASRSRYCFPHACLTATAHHSCSPRPLHHALQHPRPRHNHTHTHTHTIILTTPDPTCSRAPLPPTTCCAPHCPCWRGSDGPQPSFCQHRTQSLLLAGRHMPSAPSWRPPVGDIHYRHYCSSLGCGRAQFSHTCNVLLSVMLTYVRHPDDPVPPTSPRPVLTPSLCPMQLPPMAEGGTPPWERCPRQPPHRAAAQPPPRAHCELPGAGGWRHSAAAAAAAQGGG
jgi:hypothetical protein